MIHYIFAVVLSIIALVTAFLHVRSEVLGLSGRTAPPQPLTTLIVLIIAIIAPQPVALYYKGAIIFGLLVSLVADAFAVAPGNPRITVTGHLLLAYFVYLTAFASQTALNLRTPWILVLILYGALFYWQVVAGLRELRVTILIYMVMMGLMTWQALEMALLNNALWSKAALLGAVVLVLAESIRSFDIHRTRIPNGSTYAVAAYLLAQWLLAASVWGSLLIPR